MKPIRPEEIVTNEEALELLKKLLVLCPSYSRPEVKTAELLTVLTKLGAELLLRTGLSDIATARNLLASDAYHRLHEDDGFRFEALFWIDGDMTASPHHIAALVKMALEHQAGVCGLCCPRGDPSRIAAKRLPVVDSPKEGDVELYPVYSGLACMALPRQEFIHLCNMADWFVLNGNRKAPAICQSRMTENLSGQKSWLSEDIYYSEHAWHHGNGIYLAPIEFGHLSLVSIHPDVNAVFLDDHSADNGPPTVR